LLFVCFYFELVTKCYEHVNAWLVGLRMKSKSCVSNVYVQH
jgi:hypothetical protein